MSATAIITGTLCQIKLDYSTLQLPVQKPPWTSIIILLEMEKNQDVDNLKKKNSPLKTTSDHVIQDVITDIVTYN